MIGAIGKRVTLLRIIRWNFAIVGISLLAALSLGPSDARADNVVRVSLYGPFNHLDPAKTTTGLEYNFVHAIFDGLTDIDRDMKLHPALAESWGASEGGKLWIFHLRQGVKFHNGKVLDASDVLATFKRILDPKTASPVRQDFKIITDLAAPDQNTVEFTLSQPYADFPALLADYRAVIQPNGGFTTPDDNPIGTGPFEFVEYLPGDRMTLKKNPDYWKPGIPKVDGVVFTVVPEYASQVAGLLSGDADIVWSLPDEYDDQLKASSTAHIDSVQGASWLMIGMRNDIPPFNDVRVRQAIFNAIDKEELTNAATFGRGIPTHTPIPPSSPYYAKDLPLPKPNFDKAKSLLAAAGFANGLKLTMWFPNSEPTQQRLAVTFRDEMKKAGIEVDLQGAPSDKFYSEIEGKQPLFTDQFYSRATADTSVFSWYYSGGSWNANTWNFKDAEVDKTLTEARETQSESKRKDLYLQFQRIIEERGPGPVIGMIPETEGLNNRIVGTPALPRVWLDLREISIKEQ
jgi:peptide/nickel transport system substrate-binding protein